MCGCCSSRCPASISHPQVGILACRLTGKYLAPEAKHLTKRVQEIKDGKFDEQMKTVYETSNEEFRALYKARDIEK